MRSQRKVYQNFIFNFEDIWKRKFVFYQALLLSSTLATCFIPSVETSYSDRVDMLYINFIRSWDSPDRIGLLAKKEVNDIKGFFSVNLFIIKQRMLLTFLQLLRIAQKQGLHDLFTFFESF